MWIALLFEIIYPPFMTLNFVISLGVQVHCGFVCLFSVHCQLLNRAMLTKAKAAKRASKATSGVVDGATRMAFKCYCLSFEDRGRGTATLACNVRFVSGQLASASNVRV